MAIEFSSAFISSVSKSLMWILLDSSVKATILLAVAVASTWFLRRASAEMRDRIWKLTFCGAIAIPLITACLPQWRITIGDSRTLDSRVARQVTQEGHLTDPSEELLAQNIKKRPDRRRQRANEIELADEFSRPEEFEMSALTTSQNGAVGPSDSSAVSTFIGQFNSIVQLTLSRIARMADYSGLFAASWIVGFAFLAAPFALAVVTTWTLLITGKRLNDPVSRQRLDAIAMRLRLQRRVTLLQADHETVPMTFGVLRPAVVLPSNWQSWPMNRIQFVMLHELTHIKRFDVLFQSIARLACAVFWFNPLAWYAFHRMRIDCELACDDRVIETGERASEYADQLIEIARLYRPTRFSLGIAMARPSKLEGRILALLDGNRSRVPVGKNASRSLFMIAAILVIVLSSISVGQSKAVAVELSNDLKDDSTTITPHAQAALKANAIESKAVPPKLASKPTVGERDWPQWGGSSHRNNTPTGENIPVKWNLETGENLLWTAHLGTQSYNTPVIANGKVFMGTNNAHGYLKRFPASTDLGVLLAFAETTGEFLWQASSPKLETGRTHDWPLIGLCSTPYCEDSRLWYVTNRGEIVCLDAEGFRDGVNNGPFKSEPNENKDEADIIWRFDMIGELGVSPHNATTSSITCLGDRCFVITGNGVDESHNRLPSSTAPSFLAFDKNTGKRLWSDNSPGQNIIHGQWSSPCAFEAGGREQVVMPGGDGWLYSFDAAGDGNGGARLLWKFDGNPKESIYLLGTRATRNYFIATPVFYEGSVYIGVGEDPEHGEGVGHLYCIDPTKSGDVSIELAVDKEGKLIPHKRIQAVDRNRGEKAIPNPNSGVVWHYESYDHNQNGKYEFEEIMHRTISTVAIKNDLLIVPDFAGLVHCLDAKKVENGKPVVYWTHDMLSAAWTSAMIVENKVYVCDEDGDVTVFELSSKKRILAENNLGQSIFSTPVVANHILYVSNVKELIAIKAGSKLEGGLKKIAQ